MCPGDVCLVRGSYPGPSIPRKKSRISDLLSRVRNSWQRTAHGLSRELIWFWGGALYHEQSAPVPAEPLPGKGFWGTGRNFEGFPGISHIPEVSRRGHFSCPVSQQKPRDTTLCHMKFGHELEEKKRKKCLETFDCGHGIIPCRLNDTLDSFCKRC